MEKVKARVLVILNLIQPRQEKPRDPDNVFVVGSGDLVFFLHVYEIARSRVLKRRYTGSRRVGMTILDFRLQISQNRLPRHPPRRPRRLQIKPSRHSIDI